MSKSKKPRAKVTKQILTNDLLKELQATIAFACFDSPSVLRRGGSLAEAAIENKMSQIFYGDVTHEALDPDFILFEDQFLLGVNKFKGMFMQSAGVEDATGTVLRVIPEVIHRHKRLLVYAGDGSIEKRLLSQKSLHVTDKKITGRTLHTMGKNVLKNCKKMMAIVKRKDSPYKNGTFPSGTNWEDYILWCLIAMGKECDREDAALIDAALKKAAAEKAVANVLANAGRGVPNPATTMNAAVSNGNANVDHAANEAGTHESNIDSSVGFEVETRGGGEQEGSQQLPSDNPPLVPEEDDEDGYPDNTFFKCGPGFIAWALWGSIPVYDCAGMQASFFGDAKKNAAFGRNKESRAAFRNLLIGKNSVGVDNRRGKKRRVEEEESIPLTPVPSSNSYKILEKSLQFMATESLESKRQKLAEMGMRNIRDKLITQRRKEDALYKLFDRLTRNKKPDQAMLDKQTAIENEIATLEIKLDELQGEEYRRHSNVIDQRGLELTASFSSEESTIMIRSDSNVNDSDSVNVPTIDVDDGGVVDDDGVLEDDDDEDDVVEYVVAQAPVNITNSNKGCVECNLPSNHVCRKCKKCVCSLCCGEKRELENAWWCGLCFGTQSVANQHLIRDGLYCSDIDDD